MVFCVGHNFYSAVTLGVAFWYFKGTFFRNIQKKYRGMGLFAHFFVSEVLSHLKQPHLISTERTLEISRQRGIGQTLDDLDKKILQNLSVGTSSYEELAKTCNVSRNTVYRRIASLENKGIIKSVLQCSINLEELDITPITIGAKILQSEQEKAVRLLSANSHVRLLLRTYGDST